MITKVIGILIFFFSFHMLNPFLSFAENLEAQKDDIRRTVFEYLFKNNESSLKGNAAAYCIFVEGEVDPSKELIEKLRNISSLVKPMSDCEKLASVEGKENDDAIVDKKTRRAALRFEIREITWKDNTEVIVEGGYYEHSLSASIHLITLKKVDSKWNVIKDKLFVIS